MKDSTLHGSAGKSALSALVAHLGARQVLYIDETWRTIPEWAALPASVNAERCLLPAAAASLVVPATVMCRRPPSPLEIEAARELAGDNPLRIVVWDGARFRDSECIGESELWRLWADPSVSASNEQCAAAIFELSDSTTLHLPYETRSESLAGLRPPGRFCDAADVLSDKNRACEIIQNHGLAEHVPRGIAVPASPAPAFAARMVEAIDLLQSQVGNAYAKLCTSGLSGIANVVPSQYLGIYDSRRPAGSRVAEFLSLIHERRIPTTACSGRVEEKLERDWDSAGEREFTVGGLMVDGVFHPIYLGRNVNSADHATEGMIHSRDETRLDSKPERLRAVAREIFEALGAEGYRNGYAYADLSVTVDGRIVATDFNLRRGLRSPAEALLPTTSQPLHDVSLTLMDIPSGGRARELAEGLFSTGVVWYGTPGFACVGKINMLIPTQDVSLAARATAIRDVGGFINDVVSGPRSRG